MQVYPQPGIWEHARIGPRARLHLSQHTHIFQFITIVCRKQTAFEYIISDKQMEWCLFWIPMDPISMYQATAVFWQPEALETEQYAMNIRRDSFLENSSAAKINISNGSHGVGEGCIMQNMHLKKEESNFQLPPAQTHKQIEQHSGRNSASNILRSFSKFIKMQPFKQAFDKIKQSSPLKITFREFCCWTSGIGLTVHKYIRIKRVLKGIRSKASHGRILYALFKSFESNFARCMILTSSKTESKNVMPSLRQVRKIKQSFGAAITEGLGHQKNK